MFTRPVCVSRDGELSEALPQSISINKSSVGVAPPESIHTALQHNKDSKKRQDIVEQMDKKSAQGKNCEFTA